MKKEDKNKIQIGKYLIENLGICFVYHENGGLIGILSNEDYNSIILPLKESEEASKKLIEKIFFKY